MIDPRGVIENENTLAALQRRGVPAPLLVDLKKRFQSVRSHTVALERLYAERNGAAHKKDITAGRKIKAAIEKAERARNKETTAFEKVLGRIPNIPAPEVPDGKDENDNIEQRTWGTIPEFSFKPKDHIELGKELDLIDVPRAARVAGSRFSYLKNQAVLLEFGLVRMAFDVLGKVGFHPIVPPVMIRKEIARKTGYEEAVSETDAFALKNDDLFLVGTSEQSIVPYFQDEILAEIDLPYRFVGFSTCFRREAGSYGKDVHGILRQHQFDKVEMVSFAHPQKSSQEHDFLLSMGERLMQMLELPYRVMLMCLGELAAPQAKKYDIEVWIPSQKRYRETHSTSNCTDFQARNFNIRYRDQNGKTDFAHILNGTAFSIGRPLIALLENHQQKDGSIRVPKALAEYVGFAEIKPIGTVSRQSKHGRGDDN